MAKLKLLAPTTLILAGLMLIGPAVAATSTEKTQAQAKEAELERLRSTIQDLSKNLNTLRSQHEEGNTKLRAVNQKIRQINRSLRDAEEQRERQTDRLAELQREKQDKQVLLKAQRQTLTRQLRAAYLLGQQSFLKIMLNATEPAALQRGLKYYDYFYRSRAQHIKNLSETLRTIDTLELTIQGQQRELNDLLVSQRSQREALEVSRRERRTLLAELNRDIQDTRQRLSRLKEDEQSLQELVKRLRRALARIPTPRTPGKSFAQLKGQLPLPAKGDIAARFGSPRQIGQLKWQGIVIDAADGADVKAVAAARVVFSDWLRGFGLLLILDHGDGYMSLYGYNQGLNVSVGDTVKVGESIATVSNSGAHNQSGLYFEIRYQGSPVDPLLWCKNN